MPKHNDCIMGIADSPAGKEIPGDGDAQRLLLYAGADHVLHKVWELNIIEVMLLPYICMRSSDSEAVLFFTL